VRYAARVSKIPAMSRERGDRGDRMTDFALIRAARTETALPG
jgi:hypothetical protein